MSTENNENNNRQEPKRVRQLLLMLILSWIALISVTVQYVRYRQQVVQQTEGRLSGEDPELTALQSDYQKAMEMADNAEQLEADRASAMDTVAAFVNDFFINSENFCMIPRLLYFLFLSGVTSMYSIAHAHLGCAGGVRSVVTLVPIPLKENSSSMPISTPSKELHKEHTISSPDVLHLFTTSPINFCSCACLTLSSAPLL